MSPNHLLDLIANSKYRIERRSGFLVNHRDSSPANFLELSVCHADEIVAAKGSRAAHNNSGGRKQAEQS